MSGRRKNPYQVRVNTHINEDGYPVYDVLASYPDRVSAEIALAEYNKAPYNPQDRKKLFSEVFASWYLWKYKEPITAAGKKTSSQYLYRVSIQEMPHPPQYAHVGHTRG